jgi:hypothetical protein
MNRREETEKFCFFYREAASQRASPRFVPHHSSRKPSSAGVAATAEDGDRFDATRWTALSTAHTVDFGRNLGNRKI